MMRNKVFLSGAITFGFYLVIFLFVSCKNVPGYVQNVNPERFAGKWYELASLPTTYNNGCKCNKIEMELNKEDGYIRMINSCIKKEKTGAVLSKCYFGDNPSNGVWKLQYFWPFRSDYIIYVLDINYNYALVGNPDHAFLQILSRTSELDSETYEMLFEKASSLGFNTGELQKTVQDCENW